jgi:hypothetical protein
MPKLSCAQLRDHLVLRHNHLSSGSSFILTMLCILMIRIRRYLFTYFTWKTLSNHVFEDLRKPKAPKIGLNWPLEQHSSWLTGHCPVHTRQSSAPTNCWLRPRVALWLRCRPLAQSTVDSPDNPVNYSRTPPNFAREWPVHRSSAWRIGHCPVHQRTVWCARLSRVLAAPSQDFLQFFSRCF